jgi:hypothetical protein
MGSDFGGWEFSLRNGLISWPGTRPGHQRLFELCDYEFAIHALSDELNLRAFR